MCWYWQTCEQKGLIYWNLKCYWYIFVQPSPRINIHHAFCKAIFWPCLLLRDELQAQLTPFPYPTSAIKLSTVQGVDWNWLFFISVVLSSCFFLFHFVFPHFFFFTTSPSAVYLLNLHTMCCSILLELKCYLDIFWTMPRVILCTLRSSNS